MNTSIRLSVACRGGSLHLGLAVRVRMNQMAANAKRASGQHETGKEKLWKREQ